MKRILNFIFGKTTKKGRCHWWNHEYGPTEKRYYDSGTGKYIGDQQIIEKRYYEASTCTKCGYEWIGDSFPIYIR